MREDRTTNDCISKKVSRQYLWRRQERKSVVSSMKRFVISLH